MIRIGFKNRWGIPIFAIVMCVAAYGWRSVSLAQSTNKAKNEPPVARPILGTTRDGIPADRTYFGGADIKDTYVQELDVQGTWSIRNTSPFRFTVVLSKQDKSKDRLIIIKMRPVLKDRGLGNGYTWRVNVLKDQLAATFTARAIDPPTSKQGATLPTGTYLMEAFQEQGPASLPHAFGFLKVTDAPIDPDTVSEITKGTQQPLHFQPDPLNFLRVVFTAITKIKINNVSDDSIPSVKSGDKFLCTIIPKLTENREHDDPVMVNMVIQKRDDNGTVHDVRIYDKVAMDMTDGPPKSPAATTFSIDAKEKDTNIGFKPGNYQLKVTRDENGTPSATSVFADLTITK